MPLEAKREHPESRKTISAGSYSSLKDELWKHANPVNNPERRVFTASWSVQTDDHSPPPLKPPVDIIESVSPDISIRSIGEMVEGKRKFMIIAGTRSFESGKVDVDTDDLELVRQIHYAFVLKFEETLNLRATFLWLIEQSEYSRMKGTESDRLLMLTFYRAK